MMNEEKQFDNNNKFNLKFVTALMMYHKNDDEFANWTLKREYGYDTTIRNDCREIIEEAANQGNANAQCYLGDCYGNGRKALTVNFNSIKLC